MNTVAKHADLEKKSWADMTEEQEAEDIIKENEDVFYMKYGTSIPINLDDSHFKREHRDEYTKEVLPRHLVKQAMQEELKWFDKVVWRGTTKEKDNKDPTQKRQPI